MKKRQVLRMRKKAAGVLIGLLCLTLVIGCSSNNGNSASSGQASGSGEQNAEVTITTVRGLGGDTQFKNGETIENNWHTKWAKEKLGMNIKYNWIITDQSQSYKTKLRMILASGEQMPDVFATSDIDIVANFAEAGKSMDITEAFEKYASPRMKELYAKHPEVWNYVTRDGKKYALPFFTGGEPISVMWIRQDWLDKLKLTAPTTIEEMERVMDAFVNQDPDGNNKKDTIGMSLSLKDGITPHMSDASFLVGAMGAQIPDYWHEAEDGTLRSGNTDPKVKDVLAKLNEWYSKGYIDREAAIHDAAKATESFIQGKSGIVFASWWAPLWPLGDLVKNDPNAVYKPYPVPSGPDGKRGVMGQVPISFTLVFNKDFKHMDKMLQYVDQLYGFAFDDPNSDFKYGWAEGYDYIMENGKPSFDQSKIPGGFIEAQKYLLTPDFPEVPGGLVEVYNRLATGKTPETPAEIRQAGHDPIVIEGGKVIYSQMKDAIYNKFTTIPTETMVKQNEILLKMQRETFSSIIYGKKQADAFDQFVKDWKANGGDKITEEVNAWYKESKNAK
ncbi:extracellular solute-binding protein [Cohnella herbarum]|uniref:Extracellular solute-binding protein n=1 Tax=Cohnella herbarum TaxID=2728023 RepID=A0A7Z2VQ63_9BACL|nr:extracellular solute-binding protein [Cohnella herbarum]QJD87151.1 extracellular solute-binding protein [Cohnella herbarum]